MSTSVLYKVGDYFANQNTSTRNYFDVAVSKAWYIGLNLNLLKKMERGFLECSMPMPYISQ